MDLNHPVDKGWSYGFINLILFWHIRWVTIPFRFCEEHVFLNYLDVFRNLVDVGYCLFINFGNMTEDLVVTSLIEHLKLLVQTDFRQLISWWSSVCWSCSFWLSNTESTYWCCLYNSLALCRCCYLWCWVSSKW